MILGTTIAKYLNLLHRIQPDKSLFEITTEEEVGDREEAEAEAEKSCYCSLEGESIQAEKCDYNSNLFARMSSSVTEVITTQLNDQSTFGKKRSVDSHWYSDNVIDHVERSYFVDDAQAQHATNRLRSKRSLKTVMTEKVATKYCQRHIKETKAGMSCKDISQENIDNAIKICSKDLQVRMILQQCQS